MILGVTVQAIQISITLIINYYLCVWMIHMEMKCTEGNILKDIPPVVSSSMKKEMQCTKGNYFLCWCSIIWHESL